MRFYNLAELYLLKKPEKFSIKVLYIYIFLGTPDALFDIGVDLIVLMFKWPMSLHAYDLNWDVCSTRAEFYCYANFQIKPIRATLLQILFSQ